MATFSEVLGNLASQVRRVTRRSGTLSLSDMSAVLEEITIVPAKDVEPSREAYTTVMTSGQLAAGEIRVAPIPSEYIKPKDTLRVIYNGNYDVSEYAELRVEVSTSGECPHTEKQQVIIENTGSEITHREFTVYYADFSEAGSFTTKSAEIFPGEKLELQILPGTTVFLVCDNRGLMSSTHEDFKTEALRKGHVINDRTLITTNSFSAYCMSDRTGS
jgi:hypothetical protein